MRADDASEMRKGSQPPNRSQSPNLDSRLRALVVSNMRPDASHPERGQFVRDQVAALQELRGLDVELYELPPGAPSLAKGFAELWLRRHRRRGQLRGGNGGGAARFDGGGAVRFDGGGAVRFDVVHAHFSLSALPALGASARVRGVTLHGTDVRHPRTRRATQALLPLMDLVVAVSKELAGELPGAAARQRAIVIPTGVNLERFKPIPREAARAELGLKADVPYLLFPADPLRASKRHDLAEALANASGARLLSLGGVPPDRVPLLINASNAVLIPSEKEGFGLAALEALACEVPVLATPVGIHEEALKGINGTLCAPFELDRWLKALRPHLDAADRRVNGRERASGLSTQRMAAKLAEAWRRTLSE